MHTADVRPYLTASELQIYDTLIGKAFRAREQEQRETVARCMARKPKGNRMNVDGRKPALSGRTIS